MSRFCIKLPFEPWIGGPVSGLIPMIPMTSGHTGFSSKHTQICLIFPQSAGFEANLAYCNFHPQGPMRDVAPVPGVGIYENRTDKVIVGYSLTCFRLAPQRRTRRKLTCRVDAYWQRMAVGYSPTTLHQQAQRPPWCMRGTD